jgi:hypothetical protein
MLLSNVLRETPKVYKRLLRLVAVQEKLPNCQGESPAVSEPFSLSLISSVTLKDFVPDLLLIKFHVNVVLVTVIHLAKKSLPL